MNTPISRNMIVQSEAVRCVHRPALVLLTNKTDEELTKADVPVMAAIECTKLPLNKSLSELYRGECSSSGTFGCTAADVTILSNKRHSEYKYVGIVHDRHETVECWNEEGKPESNNPEHVLSRYPEERSGYIAIYKGCVSGRIYESANMAAQELARDHGIAVGDLDRKELFTIQVVCSVDPDKDEHVI